MFPTGTARLLGRFSRLFFGVSGVAFQRKKPAAIGVKAPFPGFIEPALATSIERVPSGERWIHEIKFDGYRVQVHLANETAKIFTRRGHDWTHRFKKVAHDAWRIKASSAVRRDRRPRRRRQHRFLGAAERAQGQVGEHCAGSLRSALSEWPRSSEAAADPEESRAQENRRWHRCPVQRKLRDRG